MPAATTASASGETAAPHPRPRPDARPFAGVFTALVTPFRDNVPDWTDLRKLVDYQVAGGVDGLVSVGTTGESPTLETSEHLEVVARTVEFAAGRVPVLAGTGSNSTAEAIELTREADRLGADGFLLVAPYYNKPSQEGIYQHFKSIAKNSPLPIVLYNVPGRTGINMTAETTLRLAREFTNIIAVKEASGNITQMDGIIKQKPSEFQVISGDDGITFPLIALGAVGVISVIGNAFPKEFSRMVRLALEGDYNNARIIHSRFMELFELLFVDGNPAGVKSMLNMMGFIDNYLRLPLVPTRITTFEKIREVLQKLNIRIVDKKNGEPNSD